MAAPLKGSKRGAIPTTGRTAYYAREHLKCSYRSGLEESLAKQIVEALGPASLAYETSRLRFTQPAKERTYTPDFLLPNGIYIESKGLFTAEDRAKMLWVKAQHPELDIRMVFSNPASRLSKASQTTYADWCTKHGIQYAKRTIPAEWLTEPPKSGTPTP